jgi:hypothetical protein
LATANKELSRTCTVKVEFPVREGVPPIVPVDASSVKPLGSDPEVTDQV